MIDFYEIYKYKQVAVHEQVEVNKEELDNTESDPDIHHDVMMNCIFEANDLTYDNYVKQIVKHHLTEQGVLNIDPDGSDMQVPITLSNLQDLIINVASDVSYLVGVVYQDKTKDTLSQYTADLFNDINN